MLDRRIRFVLMACIATSVLTILPSAPRAEESFADRIEGTWEATTTDQQAREKIDEEIDEVVGQMIFFKRPFARNELQEATEPCSELQIAVADEKATIRCDDRKPTTAPKDGTSIEWTSYEGETYMITQHVRDDRIVQTFDSDRGLRTNTYSLTDGEKLRLEVEIDGDQLPEALTYERTFERDE